jgi:hypothetical protein
VGHKIFFKILITDISMMSKDNIKIQKSSSIANIGLVCQFACILGKDRLPLGFLSDHGGTEPMLASFEV